MFTSIDKALVALVMALIYMANAFFNTGLVVPEDMVASVVALLTPLLVWAIPNRPE